MIYIFMIIFIHKYKSTHATSRTSIVTNGTKWKKIILARVVSKSKPEYRCVQLTRFGIGANHAQSRILGTGIGFLSGSFA